MARQTKAQREAAAAKKAEEAALAAAEAKAAEENQTEEGAVVEQETENADTDVASEPTDQPVEGDEQGTEDDEVEGDEPETVEGEGDEPEVGESKGDEPEPREELKTKTPPEVSGAVAEEKEVVELNQPVAAFKAELDRYITNTNPMLAKTDKDIIADQSVLYRALLRIWRMKPKDMLTALAIADAYWTEHRNSYLAPVKTWRLCALVKLPRPKDPALVKQTLSMLESVANTASTDGVKKIFNFTQIKELVSDEAKDVLVEYFKL